MQRREFLTVAAAGGATLAAGVPQAAAANEGAGALPLGPPPEVIRGGMRYRKLGTTGIEVSAVGLGGFHIGIQKDENESIRIIRTAIDNGVTFLDNSWDYNNGASEERMGKALREGYRDKVFVMTKIDGRTKKEAGRLGMKPLASGAILKTKTVSAVECLSYALSLPTSVVITGCDSLSVLKQALEVAKNFEPLNADSVAGLLQKTAVAAAEGRYELFKTDTRFDATAHHPEWLG
jgi:predicted aldo/keto reductase-like oxidoreductase